MDLSKISKEELERIGKVKGNFYSRETENNQLEFDELINRPIANLTYNSEGKLEVVNKYWCRQFPKYTPL